MQLDYANELGRVVFTYNIDDFCRLHAKYVESGTTHAGIIVGDQIHSTVGQQIRALLKLVAEREMPDFRNTLEFLRVEM